MTFELDNIDEQKFDEWKKKFDNRGLEYGIHLGSLVLPLAVAMDSQISLMSATFEIVRENEV